MTTFLDLPAEIRLAIYEYVFRGAAVKFMPDVNSRVNVVGGPFPYDIATSVSLLMSSKAIYYDSLKTFYESVRINIGTMLHKDTGILRLSNSNTDISGPTKNTFEWLDPTLIQRVSIPAWTFHGGTKKFIKSLANLKSVQYYGTRDYEVFIEDHGLAPNQQAVAKWTDEYRKSYLKVVADCINENPEKVIGRVCDPFLRDFPCDCCDKELPVRSFVAVWAWNDMPFQLTAKIYVDEENSSHHKMRAFIDLGTKMMTVIDPKTSDAVGDVLLEDIEY